MKTEKEIEAEICRLVTLESLARVMLVCGSAIEEPKWQRNLFFYQDMRRVLEWVQGRCDDPYPTHTKCDAPGGYFK